MSAKSTPQQSISLAHALSDHLCIHQLIEAQTRRRPHNIAVADEREQLTYEQLDRQANQVAHYLRLMNGDSQQPVGIYMKQSVRAIVSMLGSLKAGCPYVPIDTRYPLARVTTILCDAGTQLVITDSAFGVHLQQTNYTLICLDDDWQTITQQSQQAPQIVAHESDLAYIIFTSGSTGRPKGVEIEHHSLRNLIQWHQQAFQITENDRATLFASIAFDASVWELWPYLCTGASVHVIPQDIHSSLKHLQSWLIDMHITVSFFPTPLAEQIIVLDWPDDSALRIMLTGGDRLHHYPPASLPFTFVNNYGPTENTVVATSAVIPPKHDGEPQGLPPIGKPINNVEIFLLDEQRQPVADGAVGEIYLAGAGVARGYRYQPQLTKECFLPYPFSSHRQDRLYKTGDFAQRSTDGSLLFLGRNDQQVKIRGFRIEIAEIQARLGSHMAIRNTNVITMPDSTGNDQLVAFYVMKDTNLYISNDELRNYLKETLPDYMLPAHFVKLEALPLLASGKIDREQLVSLYTSQMEERAAVLLPGNDIEQQLVEIWSLLLKGHQFGLQDNFFKIGGHSLSVLQLIMHVRKTFQVSLTVRDIFQMPTIIQLATVIQQKQKTKTFHYCHDRE